MFSGIIVGTRGRLKCSRGFGLVLLIERSDRPPEPQHRDFDRAREADFHGWLQTHYSAVDIGCTMFCN